MNYEAYRENALEINSSDDFLQCEYGVAEKPKKRRSRLWQVMIFILVLR